jgi:molybdopterin synthase catalytic subunit
MIQLTDQAIDVTPFVAQAQRPGAGAVVLFLGITREFTADKRTVSLDYEAYPEMAERELARLERAARQRWPLQECLLVHRTGPVPSSEVSVAVVVSAPHRPEAFEAARWLIDELKNTVPIWKQEQWSDGTAEWVHPQSVATKLKCGFFSKTQASCLL